MPLLATWYNNTNNIDSDNNGNDNERGKTILELLKYPRYNANDGSDDDSDSKDKDSEYPVLINRVGGGNDSNDKRERKKGRLNSDRSYQEIYEYDQRIPVWIETRYIHR